MSAKQNVRLNSWKEIADFVVRDVRTVMRWEKERRMPVHRVPGDKGHGVFAYPDEIEAWLSGSNESNEPMQSPLPALSAPFTPSALTAPLTAARGLVEASPDTREVSLIKVSLSKLSLRRPLIVKVGLAAVILFGSAALVLLRGRTSSEVHSVSWQDEKLVARGEGGEVRWTYAFPQPAPFIEGQPGIEKTDLDGDGRDEILVDFQMHERDPLRSMGTELYCFSPDGRIQWRFALRDTLSFSSGSYGPPWATRSWLIYSIRGEKKIALAESHYTWWPSVVVQLDSRGRMLGRFTNSGWIFRLGTMETDAGTVLLAGGVSNSRRAGIMAVLDGDRISGISPEDSGSEYECKSCAPGRPLAYFVFPRSDLNVMFGSMYNYNWVWPTTFKDRIEARALEFDSPSGTEQAEAIYEFSTDLKLISARFSDKYWDLHRRLEMQGKINHSREQCPDRDGPKTVRRWDPKSGWTELLVRKNP